MVIYGSNSNTGAELSSCERLLKVRAGSSYSTSEATMLQFTSKVGTKGKLATDPGAPLNKNNNR